MKKIFRLLCTAFFLLTSMKTLQAQWVQTNGPAGGSVTAFAASGKNLAVGSSSGYFYTSTDDGLSWKIVKTGINNGSPYALAYSGSDIFAATSNGVSVSTSSGTSWTRLKTAVLTIFSSGSSLYAGTNGDGIFQSKDHGVTWTAINSGLRGGVSAVALIMKDTMLFAGTYQGVYRSVNNGASWTFANTGLPEYAMSISFATDGSSIYAVIEGSLYVSSDNGTSWSKINTPITNMKLTAVSGGNLIVTSSGDIYVSKDKGASWNSAGIDYFGSDYFTTLTVNGSEVFAGTSLNGLYRSTDNGISWNQTSLPGSTIGSLAVMGSTIIAGTNHTGCFRSTDNGATWTAANSGMPARDVNSVSIFGTSLFAGTDVGVYQSTDNGSTWAATGLVYWTFDVVSNGTNLFAKGMGSTFALRSSDNGKTWNKFQMDVQDAYIYSFATSGANIFAGTNRGVFLSSDNGVSWRAVNSGLTDTSIAFLAANNGMIFSSTHLGLFRSLNNGASWTAANTGLGNATINSIVFNGSTIFACSNGAGVFVSTDGGISWSAVNEGLTDLLARTLVIKGGDLLVGTSAGGVWRRPLSEMVTAVDDHELDVPTNFHLDQNFPNPFNPSTTISFSLPSRSHVSLKIFDMIGHVVATVVSEELPAGSYSRQWNAAGCASGVYFYRMQAEAYSETKRLVIMK